LICEFGMRGGHDVQGHRIIWYDRVQRYESIDLILRASVALEVHSHLTQIFGLVISVSDGGAVVVLWFIQIAHLSSTDDRIYFRVLGGKTLHGEHIHIRESDDEVSLLLQVRQNFFGCFKRIIDAISGIELLFGIPVEWL